MTGEAITGGRKKDFSPPGHGFSFTDLVRLVLFPVITTICHYASTISTYVYTPHWINPCNQGETQLPAGSSFDGYNYIRIYIDDLGAYN